MDKVAKLSAKDRQELFRESALRQGMNPAIVEKDFWVCWVLKRLFQADALREHLIFKGGTSLSKVFRLVNRFSEDVDVILDWRLLGYRPAGENPYPEFRSNTQRDRFKKEFNQRAARYIAETLLDQLRELFSLRAGVAASVAPDDPHTVDVAYPAAFGESYLRPQIRLEIGPPAYWVPSSPHTIRPYAAEVFPEIFEDSECPVVAIDAERTFWEKPAILHQQAHRVGPMRARYSRRYYDLRMLATSSVRRAALTRVDLLADVVAFKRRFYSVRGLGIKPPSPAR